jgi:hypothetical protein
MASQALASAKQAQSRVFQFLNYVSRMHQQVFADRNSCLRFLRAFILAQRSTAASCSGMARP